MLGRRMAKTIRVVVPDAIYQRMRKLGEEHGITIQDIMIRAIVKALEDFERVGKGGRR